MLLVIDDDFDVFAHRARRRRTSAVTKSLVAARGDMGLAMARKFRPKAILLDIGLPDTTGWSVLDQLQHDPDLRHVPDPCALDL